MKVRCTNPSCSRYMIGIEREEAEDIFQIEPIESSTCIECGNLLEQVFDPPEGSRPVAGLAGGALLGWALGGPAGAVIGGAIGILLGSGAEEEEKRKKKLEEW